MNYLISEDSYRLIDKEIKKIVGQNETINFNMRINSLKEVIEEASYFGLGIDKKWIVVSNANIFGSEKVSNEDTELLLSYLEMPNENSNIVFTTQDGIDLRKKITKEIKSKGVLINIDKPDKRTINVMIQDYLRSNSYDIDYNTANYIIDNSYDNLDIMLNELDKVMIFYGHPCKVKYEDIVGIVGTEKTNNNFLFVSSVIEKNLSKAIKILDNLKVYKVEPLSLVLLLAREYRLMYYVKVMYNKYSLREIMSKLQLQEWQVNKLYTNSRTYTEEELKNYLVSLCKIDINVKKGLVDKDTCLYPFLMEACS